jgi:DNA mismatch repair ATPase MutL
MNDFTNPLEVLREALQNGIDEGATDIYITETSHMQMCGEP